MDSPSSSPFSFLDVAEQPLQTPVEWSEAVVVVPLGPDDLGKARLLLQGRSLPLSIRILEGEPRVLATWPRQGTGNFELVLEVGERAIARQILSVRPQKISQDSYVALVNDLQGDALPTSIALGLARTGGLAGVRLEARAETTLEQELQRLTKAVRGSEERLGLDRALSEIARDPYRVLRKTEKWVRAERVRRLEPVGLVRALRRPENLEPRTRRPQHVPDVRVEHTYDVHENRLVRLFVDQVDRRLRRLGAALAENNQLAGLSEVEAMQRRLSIALRAATFLDEVSLPDYVPTRPTMVLLRRPLYRAVFEAFLEFHREAYVQLDDDRLDAPLDNLPHLYETWCALQVLAAALDVGTELGFETRLQRIARQNERSIFIKVLADGTPALVLVHPQDGRAIRITPQQSFGRTSTPFHSISFPQRPDITIEVSRPGKEKYLLLLDPKYKLRSESLSPALDDDALEGPAGQPKKVDIDKMHAYRDAIRNADDRRVVRFAAILYPGAPVEYGDGVEAISARPRISVPLRERLKALLGEALARG
jgi:predicted component of viral defense system (DUF524 family)